jgi:arginyl-tRNA--protein-N-Asp/Glu arginylyltransferase
VSANHEEVITSNKEERSKKSFLSEENYQLLKQYQQRVSEVTGFSPDVKKIVNDLITVENMDRVIAKYIKKLEY